MRARTYGWYLILAACGDGGGFPVDAPAEAAPKPGTFALSWTIAGGSCDDVGATTVSVAISGGFVQDFACSLGTALSGALEPGMYQLTISLRGTSVISTAPVQTIEVTAKHTTPVSVAF